MKKKPARERACDSGIMLDADYAEHLAHFVPSLHPWHAIACASALQSGHAAASFAAHPAQQCLPSLQFGHENVEFG